MKTLISTVLLLLSPQVWAGADLEEGFYPVGSSYSSARLVKIQSGSELYVGPRQPLAIQKAELFSLDNDNTSFFLSVTIRYEMDLDALPSVLVVEGTGYRQSGGASSSGRPKSLHFRLSGEAAARQVARYLEIPVLYRHHPGHRFRVRFIPTKDKFLVGEEVTVTLQITNVGTNTISFMQGGMYRGMRDNQYSFSARLGGMQVADIGTSYHHGGIAVPRILKPGDVFEDKISLNKWFAFDKAGRYEVHGSYYLDVPESGTDLACSTWEDYVSADFIIQIEQPPVRPNTDNGK